LLSKIPKCPIPHALCIPKSLTPHPSFPDFSFFTSTFRNPSLTPYDFQSKRFYAFISIFPEVYQLSTGLEIAMDMIT